MAILVWFVASLFFLYEFFLRTFIGSLAHQIIPALNLNPEKFALLGSAYCIAYGTMQVPVGMLADKFGVKKIMFFASLICAFATFLFSQTNNFHTAFLSRILTGAGSAFAFVCLLVVVANWFPRKYFACLAGLSQFIGTMGPLLAGGPLVAYMIHSHQTWRGPIVQVAEMGIILSILILVFVKDKNKKTKSNQTQKKNNFKKRLTQLIKTPQAWYIALYSGTVYIAIAVLGTIWGTEYLQFKGLSQTDAASMISIAWLGYAIGCPVLGFISDKLKKRRPVMLFCAVLALITTLMITYLKFQSYILWDYGILFALLGIATAGQNIGFAAMIEHVPHNVKATAIGLNNAMITVFTASVPPIIGVSVLHSHEFKTSFIILPILALVSVIMVVFFIKESR